MSFAEQCTIIWGPDSRPLLCATQITVVHATTLQGVAKFTSYRLYRRQVTTTRFRPFRTEERGFGLEIAITYGLVTD